MTWSMLYGAWLRYGNGGLMVEMVSARWGNVEHDMKSAHFSLYRCPRDWVSGALRWILMFKYSKFLNSDILPQFFYYSYNVPQFKFLWHFQSLISFIFNGNLDQKATRGVNWPKCPYSGCIPDFSRFLNFSFFFVLIN